MRTLDISIATPMIPYMYIVKKCDRISLGDVVEFGERKNRETNNRKKLMELSLLAGEAVLLTLPIPCWT